GIYLVIDRKLPCIDDAHVHACLNGMIEKDRMHRLAYRFIAAEREGYVRHAARDMRIRQALLDAPRRLDEFDGIVVMLLDPGRNREDIRVEDDVLRRKTGFLDQQIVAALT